MDSMDGSALCNPLSPSQFQCYSRSRRPRALGLNSVPVDAKYGPALMEFRPASLLVCSWVLLTLWLFNIAMENSPFIDDFPMKTSIYRGFSMDM